MKLPSDNNKTVAEEKKKFASTVKKQKKSMLKSLASRAIEMIFYSAFLMMQCANINNFVVFKSTIVKMQIDGCNLWKSSDRTVK